MIVMRSLTAMQESEWHLLRQEADLLNNLVIALKSGGRAAALAVVDGHEQLIPNPRSRPA